MASLGKKLHHYVPRFYLKAWAEDDLVYCLQGKQIFRSNVRNLAAANHFYRLRELSKEDVSLIRDLAIVNSPEILKPAHERLLWAFSLPHTVKRKLKSSGKAKPERLAQVDSVIANLNENLHTSIEEGFKRYLDSMLRGDLSFYADPVASPSFFRGLAAQYLRTNQATRARSILGPARLPAFERIENVLVHILAMNLGYNLYMDRQRYRIILLENNTDVPFITGDQPAINLAASPSETAPPDKFELYYPLSPKRAILLVELNSKYLPQSSSVTAMSAHMYNLHMGAHSYQQVFASARKELGSIQSYLPGFVSCF